MGPVSSLRVGVVMYPRVASQLIRAGELLAASRKLAGMGFLASVGSDMSGLMLQTVERLVAHGALVRSGKFRRSIGRLAAIGNGPVGLEVR